MGNNKKFVVEANFIEEANKLKLTLTEFLLLIFFENSDDLTFDLDKICNRLKINKEEILEAYNGLLTKGVISINSEKDNNNKIVDKVSLDKFYKMILDKKKEENNKRLKDDIFTTFEKEFRRPLNGTEFEIIKVWIDKMYDEELIIRALQEAVYNGATNIRYIDTILYEWSKKGIKTSKDVDKLMENRYDNPKLDETNIYNYNWLEDYDK